MLLGLHTPTKSTSIIFTLGNEESLKLEKSIDRHSVQINLVWTVSQTKHSISIKNTLVED